MKITLVSFFNTSNIGDKLISNTLKEKIETYGSVELIDYLGQNDFTNEIKIDNDIDENITHRKSTRENVISFINRLNLGSLLSRRSLKQSNFENKKFEEAIAQSEALVIGGGNMIFDLHHNAMWSGRFDYYVSKAKEHNIPIFAISLGIGPFQNDFQYDYSVKSLYKCDYITFRDNKSYSLFKSKAPDYNNAWVVPDPVFFLTKDKSIENKKNNVIGINLINIKLFPNNIIYDDIINAYANLVNAITSKLNYRVILYNTEAKDLQTCYDVYSLCNDKKNCEVSPVTEIEDLFSVYRKCKVVVGTRMHSLITAFSQDIPIIGLFWQQKVEGMFELIEDKDSMFSLFDLDNNIDEIVDLVYKKTMDYDYFQHNKIKKKLKTMELKNDEILKSISSIGKIS